MSSDKEVASILLKISAVTLRPKEPYKYSSGILSPIYTDCRLLMSYPKERSRVISLLVDKIKDLNLAPEVIAGTATAGIPHAAWLAAELSLPMIYARSKPKEHGKQMQIEGNLKPGQKVLVIEDLISTASSSIETANIVRSLKAKCDTIMSIFDYQLKVSKKNLTKNKITLESLTNFRTLIEVAAEEDYIKGNDVDMVLDWQTDATNWATKYGLD